MKRREFLTAGGIAGAAFLASGVSRAADRASAGHEFQLNYAPHFGMFRQLAGKDPIDQLKFAADQGFTAWEDNGMKKRPKKLQEKIARTMEDLGMQMGVFVAHGDFGKVTFAGNNQGERDQVLQDVRDSVEVAKRLNAKWTTVVLDRFDQRQQWDYQTANAIELLKGCAEICEPHGLVMVLEPLNWWTNHPGLFLEKIPQAYQICRAVDSPSCKILFDIYHQQISEGNLILNIDKAWEEIAYFQIGDNPGRKEPGTGEINYRNIFAHIHAKGFTDILGMEHGNSQPGKQGEQAVIDAYVAADSF